MYVNINTCCNGLMQKNHIAVMRTADITQDNNKHLFISAEINLLAL